MTQCADTPDRRTVWGPGLVLVGLALVFCWAVISALDTRAAAIALGKPGASESVASGRLEHRQP